MSVYSVMDCSGCVAEACSTCLEEAHCEMIEDACTLCSEGEDREEVEDLLARIEECQMRGEGSASGFDAHGGMAPSEGDVPFGGMY